MAKKKAKKGPQASKKRTAKTSKRRTAKASKAAKASKRSAAKASKRSKAPKRAGKSAKKAARPAARRAKSAKAARKKAPARRSPAKRSNRPARAPKLAARAPKVAAPAPKVVAAPRRSAAKSGRTDVIPRRPPGLDRERRTIREEETLASPPSSLDLDRSASAARSGRHEFNEKLRQHTSTGPAMTGGDVDADWEDAESVGDEAPGGDNPTPDQDIVEEIGQAMGVTYDDDEELKGGDELAERDRHRWELDPASREDDEEE